MLGAWPIDTDRLLPYMEKAGREAKQHTSWVSPNKEFEDSTRHFINSLYEDDEFRNDFESFVQPLIEPGRINSLAQTLLKLTSPGVPDLYQGTELWDLSLVDPDNRRAVDYDLRRRLLRELHRSRVEEVFKRMDEGVPKLWTIHHAIRVRQERAAVFSDDGLYTPLRAEGKKSDHLVAYMRGDSVVVMAPRLVLKLNGSWGDAWLEVPSGKWRNRLSGSVFTGGKLQIGEVLNPFPVALLLKD